MQLPHPDILAELLAKRGLSGEEAEHFLHPNYERDIHDPFLFRDMGKAVGRIHDAISGNEHIALFGDYDADGVPGTALLSEWFRKVDAPVAEVYIPNRHTEDYGLSTRAVDELAEKGVTLIITIDCGTTDVAEVAHAQSRGIDVIITDHHLPPPGLPAAFAILNPKSEGESYPFSELCGTGVAFKLVQALVRSGMYPVTTGWEKWLLDLVAIATVSDMVSLTGENRALVSFGLTVLRQTRREGLRALMNKLRLSPSTVTEDDIGFLLGPRINSASRMSHASEAYALLTTESLAEAETIATHLEEKNRERKEIVESILERVEGPLNDAELPPLIVVGEGGWSLGVLGLAASRLAESFSRPAFVWGINDDGLIKGSCRSDGTVNMVELMREAGGEELFENFGGHAEAGGFTVRAGQEDSFASRLTSAYEKIKHAPSARNNAAADIKLPLDAVTPATYRSFAQLAPFGMGNPKPVFLFEGVEIASVRSFGNGGIHIELTFRNSKGRTISAVGFFAKKNLGHLSFKEGDWVDLLAHIENSFYRGRAELRLRIVDVTRVA